MSSKTDFPEMLEDLDAGNFLNKIEAALSAVAFGTITHGKQGELNIKFSFKKIGDSQQVMIAHKLTFSQPTVRGKVSEEDTTETPMYVQRGGKLTILPPAPQQTTIFEQEKKVVNSNLSIVK